MLKFNVCGERHRAFAETVHLVIRTVIFENTVLSGSWPVSTAPEANPRTRIKRKRSAKGDGYNIKERLRNLSSIALLKL